MEVTAQLVKELREKTGAGMMDCKKALVECGGDLDKAVDYLREKGLAKAAKKAGRIAAEGTVASYIHGGRIGVLVEVNTETDFAAKNEEFKAFVKDVTLQIAASNPKYVTREEIPQEEIEHEKHIFKEQAMNEGKPDHIAEKMVAGRIEKYFQEICLMEQPFIKDPDSTLNDCLINLIAKIGENIKVRRFTRYEVGEGIEKKSDDFAEEVMKQING